MPKPLGDSWHVLRDSIASLFDPRGAFVYTFNRGGLLDLRSGRYGYLVSVPQQSWASAIQCFLEDSREHTLQFMPLGKLQLLSPRAYLPSTSVCLPSALRGGMLTVQCNNKWKMSPMEQRTDMLLSIKDWVSLSSEFLPVTKLLWVLLSIHYAQPHGTVVLWQVTPEDL